MAPLNGSTSGSTPSNILALVGDDFSNGSSNHSSKEDRNESLEKNWVALLIMLAIVVTVTGNILVIMAVSLERKLQNATNYFLMSLAITDMLLGLLVMPVSMVTILYSELRNCSSENCTVLR